MIGPRLKITIEADSNKAVSLELQYDQSCQHIAGESLPGKQWILLCKSQGQYLLVQILSSGFTEQLCVKPTVFVLILMKQSSLDCEFIK